MDRILGALLYRSPFRIVLVYFLIGFAWIHFSDQWVLAMFEGPESVTLVQTYKGWLFVTLGCFLIYSLVWANNSMLNEVIDNLRKSKNEFDATFQEAAVGIAHHWPDEKLIQVNQFFCEMLGYEKEELIHLDFEDLIHPDHLQRGRELDLELVDGHRSRYQMEKSYRKKDGTYITGLLTKSAVYRDDNSVDYLIAIIEEITRIKETEKKLIESLREKEVLLSEVHHRVKNNLALISALFDLQSSHTNNRQVQQILEDTRMRIKCLAMVYETFSGSEKSANVKFGEYLHQLINYISETLDPPHRIRVKKEITMVRLNINQAVPSGLICNELLTNAYLHAFKDIERPVIDICLTEKDEQITLRITDNGTGLPESTYTEDPSTLGFTIVNSLVSQLDAELQITNSHSGTCFIITFYKLQIKGPSSSIT